MARFSLVKTDNPLAVSVFSIHIWQLDKDGCIRDFHLDGHKMTIEGVFYDLSQNVWSSDA